MVSILFIAGNLREHTGMMKAILDAHLFDDQIDNRVKTNLQFV